MEFLYQEKTLNKIKLYKKENGNRYSVGTAQPNSHGKQKFGYGLDQVIPIVKYIK